MQKQQCEVCQNCHKQLPVSKIATHFGYCKRNIKKCGECGEMYDVNLKQQHQDDFHNQAQCKYCKQKLLKKQIQKHVDNCSKKPKYCEYCELNIPLHQFEIHIQQCAARTKPCQKCGRAIMNKFYFVHLASCENPPKSDPPSIKKQKEKIPLTRKQQFETCQYPNLIKSKNVTKQQNKPLQKRTRGQRRNIHNQYQKMKRSERYKIEKQVQKNIRQQPEQKAKTTTTFIDLDDDSSSQEQSVSKSSKSVKKYQSQLNQLQQFGLDQDELIQRAIIASLQMANKQKQIQHSVEIVSTQVDIKKITKKKSKK